MNSTPAIVERDRRAILPTGETFQLDQWDDVCALVDRLEQIERVCRDERRRQLDRLRELLHENGETEREIGDYLVAEQTGRASYDGDALYADLQAVGLPAVRLAALFERRVRDARELGKLERRRADIAEIVDRHRTRSAGRMVVTPRPPSRAELGEGAE